MPGGGSELHDAGAVIKLNGVLGYRYIVVSCYGDHKGILLLASASASFHFLFLWGLQAVLRSCFGLQQGHSDAARWESLKMLRCDRRGGRENRNTPTRWRA